MSSTKLFLLDKGIWDCLHAVHWTNENDGRASTNRESQRSGVVRDFVRVIGITQMFDSAVQHEVQQGVKTCIEENANRVVDTCLVLVLFYTAFLMHVKI